VKTTEVNRKATKKKWKKADPRIRCGRLHDQTGRRQRVKTAARHFGIVF